MKNNQISTMDLARFLLRENPSRFINNDKVSVRSKTNVFETEVGRLLLNKTMHIISAIFISDKSFNIIPEENSWIFSSTGATFVSQNLMTKLILENKQELNIPKIISKKIKEILGMLSVYNYLEVTKFANEDENWKEINKKSLTQGTPDELSKEFDLVKVTPFFRNIAKDLHH